MKKIVTVLLPVFLLLIGCITAVEAGASVSLDSAHFPDPGFLEKVKNLDENHDDFLTDAEMSKDGFLSINEFYGVTSLEGIQYLTKIKTLMIADINISSLDLSSNTDLEYVMVDSLGLHTLKLGSKPKLTFLRCSDNLLTELDVTGCTDLYFLSCQKNQIRTLDLTGCPHYNGFNQKTAKISVAEDGWNFYQGGNYFAGLQIDENVIVTAASGTPVPYKENTSSGGSGGNEVTDAVKRARANAEKALNDAEKVTTTAGYPSSAVSSVKLAKENLNNILARDAATESQINSSLNELQEALQAAEKAKDNLKKASEEANSTSTKNSSTKDSMKVTTIKASKSTVQKGKKTIVKINTNGGKITVKGKSKNAKNKKYVKISGSKVTFQKKAPKGIYKFTVTSAAKGNYKKTTKTISIKVK